MEQVKNMNIKHMIYYLFNDMINLKAFNSSLLKIGKKLHKQMAICYIGYTTIISECDNIKSVNYLYLMIHRVVGHTEEKMGVNTQFLVLIMN